MNKENFFALLMLAIVGVSFYFFYRVFSPYIVPIAWAVILTLVFYPVYQRFNLWLRNRRSLASLVTTMLTILVIVLPGVFLSFLLGQEAVQIYRFLEEGVQTQKFEFLTKWQEIWWVEKLLEKLESWSSLTNLNLQDMVLETLKRLSSFLLNQSTKFVLGFAQFLFGFILMVFSMFYLFRDGENLLQRVKRLIPLNSEEKNLLFFRIHEMIHATIFGGVAVAILQGFLGGLAFWVLGLPSPVLWGFVMALLALIPVVGPFFVWIPAAAILAFHEHHFMKAVALILWGIFVVGLSDNFLRPILISERTKLNTLVLFFAVLGGLKAFGLLGLVAGPLVVTVCLAILDIYSSKSNGENGLEREEKNPSQS